MRISTVYAMLFLIGVGGCDGREEAVQRDVQRNRRQREATRPTTNTFNGKVIKVKDGDSIVVLRDKEQIEVRLRDIDCPELAQSFGRQAKKLVADLCLGETVTVQADGKDKYDRTLAHIILADGNELNRELVRRGYAWWYRKYSKDETLGGLEASARKNKIGLRADVKPVAPWDWRAARRAKSDVVPSEVKVVPNGVAIVALLPNPNGTDAGHEQITIGNSTGEIVKLDGWKLIDKAGNVYLLSGRVEAGKSLVVTMTEATMPLNNNGDTVALIGPDGVGRSRVSYLGSQARSGAVIRIGQ